MKLWKRRLLLAGPQVVHQQGQQGIRAPARPAVLHAESADGRKSVQPEAGTVGGADIGAAGHSSPPHSEQQTTGGN